MPIAIIASDMTITSTSIVNHLGMRFAGWVIACPSAATLCTGRAQVAVNEFTCLNNRCRHRQAGASTFDHGDRRDTTVPLMHRSVG
jgi:hypothetical protein